MGEKPIDFTAALAREGYGSEGGGTGNPPPGRWAVEIALQVLVFLVAGACWFGLPRIAAFRDVGVSARMVVAFVVVLLAEVLFRACLRGFFFCPDCRTWNRAHFTLRSLHLQIPESRAYVQLAAGDVSPLLSASPVPVPHGTGVRVAVRYCASCCRGEMRVARMEGRRAVPVSRLQRIRLEPGAVRALLELARREKEAELLAS